MSVFSELKRALPRLYRTLLTHESAVMITLAVVVGVGTGLGATFFRWLIESFHFLFMVEGVSALSFMGRWSVAVIPAIGGLFVGLLVYFFAREAKGHGVPEVMVAMSLHGGRIRPIVVLIKSLASSICIGSGGSAGREGPIVQIGSGIGSTLGQVLRLSDRRTRNLVACGAAAGIAATFNTPIGGVFFALEVIAREFGIRTFTTVVVASVVATVVAIGYMGNAPAFAVPEYALVDARELIFYVVVGVACALGAVAFIHLLHFSETFFDHKVKLPGWFKPVVGGLAVGLIGVFLPQVFGVGYESVDAALWGKWSLGMLAVLVVAKIVATSFTLGSGGSGGVFAPSLFMGAMVGGLVGTVVNHYWPDMTAPAGAYALVGMAAFFSAGARAPISAIIILFEMTRDYDIILPLMFACAISTVLSGWLSRESIYTIKLTQRGINLHPRREFDTLEGIAVGEAMKPVASLTTVSPDMPLQALARLFKESFHHGFAVIDDSGCLYGVVTLKGLERLFKTGQVEGKKASDITERQLVTAFPDETLDDVLTCFGALDVGRIPVVSRADPRKLVGMLRWSDIVRSYSQVMLELEYEPGTTLLRCSISEGDRAVGRSLRQLSLPSDCIVHYIQRAKHLVVPRGDTVVQVGDLLVILVKEGDENKVSKHLCGDSPPE